MKRLLLVFLLLGVSLFVGCGGSSGGSTPPPTVTLVSIQVTPAAPSIAPGSTQQFKATGTYSDGTTKDLTASANWLSATQSVATINVSGLATGVAAGTSSISATSGTIVGTTTLTVINPLVSIAVTPATSSIAPGATQQFTVTGTYADHTTQNITSSVAWSSTAGASITTGGLATAGPTGATVTIKATSGTISGTAVLTVNALVSIALTPATASVAPNGTQQFTATGTYFDHSTQNITSSVTWSASVGATITTGGLATGVTPNTTSTIMAAQGTISGTAVLTITNPLVSIAVTPLTASIAATFTQQFTATGTYADGSTNVITSTVTWASTAPAIATISNSQGTQGLATGVAAGTTSITATLGSVTSPPAALTVTTATLVSIAVTPANASIPLGNPQQYTAIGAFSDSSTKDITNTVTWTSSNTTKVTIVASGLATGVAVTSSPVTITATKSPGTPGTAALTVTTPTLSSIAITPSATTADTTLAQGTSRQYTATGTRTNGSSLNVTTLATWTSLTPAIATVGLHTGIVNALAVTGPHNPVTISVTYSGVTQTLQLDVTNATPTAVTVTPISATIPVGVTQRFTSTATFTDGSTQDVTAIASWSSDNTPVATIIFAGVASSISPGIANITATFGGQSGTAQLTVSTATLVSIAISPPSTVLAPGSTLNYQAVGHYSDLTTQFVGSVVTWASTNPSVVSILPGGSATGQSAGAAQISASYQGVTSNIANVVVTQFPLVSIAVAPATTKVPEGVSTQFTATGTFADSSTQTLTTNASWASSQSSVATISNAVGQQGVATGVAPGQTSITAVFASIVGSANLNVTNATLVSIAVTPANPVVTHGTPVNFTAIGTFSDQTTVNLTSQVTWSSSNATVATISSTGLANTASPGTATITATFTQNGLQVTGTTVLTVN